VFEKPVSDCLYSGAVVCFAVAVWTKRNCVSGHIGPAVGETAHVVDLQEGETVRLMERRTLAAKLATAVSALEDPTLDLRISAHDRDFPLAARGFSNAIRCMAKWLKRVCLIVELVPVKELALGTAE